MSTRPNPATMTVTQTATVLGISRSSAYECVRRGVIPSLHFGRRIVVPTTAIEALLDSAAPSATRNTSAEIR